MKKLLRQLLVITIATIFVVQPVLYLEQIKAEDAGSDHAEETPEMMSQEANVNGDDPGGDPSIAPPQLDPVVQAASDLEKIALDRSNTLSTNPDDPLTNIPFDQKYVEKLVMGPADLQQIRTLACLGNAIPDFARHDDSLAAASGKTLQEIVDLRLQHRDQWLQLIESAQDTARGELVSNLRNDLTNFACIAGMDEALAADTLAHDPDTVNAIIDYAQNKVIVDRRVLLLLTNLVTPKDQGGSGHERIRIYRIRQGYDRDAVVMSRESDAIREDIQRREQAQADTTLGDVNTADRESLGDNPIFNDSEAVASVDDAAGTSQGELIFTDNEDDANLSAHSRGEAVDISEIDNMKCTLVKKKRVGGDTKIPQPPTPIKVAWQTSSGYDSSPPPDYSSLQMNLNQIASGQFLDLLDQIGIDPDSETDLSHASFGDIVSLIGESLLAEIINSPSNSLSGYNLGDTAKMIGGMILADNLGLPRAPFIEANLLSLNDLETKIGEAVLEQKLSLKYGSIRGANLGQILENVGLRHIEKQLSLPTGTISPGMSGPELKLAIGRRIIEQTLKLEPGSFGADTTFRKLEEAGGQRKIDFLFTNPSEIDEILGLDINESYSAKYKTGALAPDSYATLVGAKQLADNAYIFNYASATGAAMQLDVNPIVGSANENQSNQNQRLNDATNTARARFEWIMSGNLSPLSDAPGVPVPASWDALYQSLGVDTLSAALSNNSETRAAIATWLQVNSQPSSTNCSIPSSIQVQVPRPDSTTGEMMTVTIPEDQMMATFGLRRGDFARLFGCYNVAPAAVFRGLGETALFNAVRNSSLAEQARARFLADHPEITSFLSDVDFYRTRIEEIIATADKIRNDWSGQNSPDAQVQAQINLIRNSISSIESSVDGLHTADISLSNISDAVRAVRSIPNIADQVMSAVTNLQNSSSDLISRANTTLTDITTIIHDIDEILSGEAQPMLSNLQISNISLTGSNASGGGGNTQTINRGMLILMLSGRLSPKDFLIAVGANTIEGSLNLPINSILYFAKYLDNPNRDKSEGVNAFFRAVGQAELEETFGMPPYFFQGEYPATNATLSDVKVHVSRAYNISEAEAGARIMQALGLPGNFSSIERGPIDRIATLVAASKTIDSRLALSEGTTANFLNGSTLDQASVGNSDIRMLAGQWNLPEDIIRTLINVRNGTETLEQGLAQRFNVNISYSGHNEFAVHASANSGTTLADQCPIDFSITTPGGTLQSSYIEDNSYVYTNQAGTHSFPSLEEARNYAATTPETQQVNFVQAIGNSLGKNTGKEATYTAALQQYLQDQNQPEAFPDTDLVAMHDALGTPLSTLNEILTREDILSQGLSQKPIGYWLEIIGKRTAERRIASTLLGSMSITFGGLRIDAADVFDLLNGNGLQVAYRIGARYLENQLGINSNMIMSLLEAPTTLLRNCSMSQIGGGLLGSALGTAPVSLSGNIYSNIGAAKIQQVLGIPAESFRGASVDELINNVGAVKFASAFGLPPNVVATSSVRTALFGNSATGYLRMPVEDQLSELDMVMHFPDYVPGTLSQVQSASSQIEQNVKNFIHRSDIWNAVADSYSSDENYQLFRFQQRIRQIDSALGLVLGTTQQMLTGAGGYTPDKYVSDVAGNTLLSSAESIMNALGLGEYSSFVVKGVALIDMVKTIKSDLQTCKAVGSRACADARVRIFNDLQTLLGVNFDAKLGLPDGTLAMIIADPQRAAYTLISNALTRLDSTLGLIDPNTGRPYSDASFTAAFQVWWSDDYKHCDTNPQNCLSNNTSEPNVIVRHIGTDPLYFPTSMPRWQGIAENIGYQLLGNWLNNSIGLGIQPIGSPSSGSYANYPSTVNLARESANMLVHGDMRIIQIIVAVKGLQALHFYDDSSNPNLPTYFRISYEDVYYAIMGNPVMEQDYVNVATQNYVHNWQNQEGYEITLPTNESELDGAVDPLYASECPPGMIADGTCVDISQPDGNFDYSTYQQDEDFSAENRSEYHVPLESISDPVPADINGDETAMEGLHASQEAARSQARADGRNNLMWRMADAQLYQLDHNIPPGFARTMFRGSGKERTIMLLTYVGNMLNVNDIKIGGISVGEIIDMLPVIQPAIDFFKDPAHFDLNGFIASGKMATLDNWLSSKMSGFLGFDIAPGTFTSLFAGLKAGDFSHDQVFTINGRQTTVPSLKNLYVDWAINKISGWADKALGLPTGTVYTAYRMYRGIQAARIAMVTATKTVNTILHAAPGTYTHDQLVAAQGKLADAKAQVTAMEAELISFIITTIFAKQIAQVEQALGLVPGTGAMLVSAAVSYLMTGAIPWVALAMFVLVNLFGVYKVEMICTADGYYPRVESPPSPAVKDNGQLGEFDAMKKNSQKQHYIDAARYKVRTVIGDALMLSDRTGDLSAIPSQIMTGRQEDVDYWQYKVDDVICSKIGGCEGTRAGLWFNPQTTSYIHIGF